jgi:hypothetical protein
MLLSNWTFLYYFDNPKAGKKTKYYTQDVSNVNIYKKRFVLLKHVLTTKQTNKEAGQLQLE